MYNRPNIKTVEAEVKAALPPQRVRDGAIRMEKQAAKWTAEGTVKGFENPSTL